MMRQSIKIVSLVLALVLVTAFSFSACSVSNANVLRVGIDNTYPPMEYKDESGKNVGFDIELAAEIAKKLGKEVKYVPTAWSAIFTALDTDKFDCIISSLSITEDRKKTIAFTRPYISNTQVLVVKSDNTTIKTAEDLKDKIVAVQMGTTSEDACKEFQLKTPFKDFKKYEGMNEALIELKLGRVDAVVCDLVVGKYFVAKDKESYALYSAGLPSEPIGVGCKKENTELSEQIDKIIEEFQNDGTLKRISEKWFGEDMTNEVGQ